MNRPNNLVSVGLGFVATTVSLTLAATAQAASFSTGELAQAVTLTFDELPFQPVDDLSFMGVTFDFKVGGSDSLDANYNSNGPGTINFVQDPSLEGDSSGILTLDFDKHISKLDFGVALNRTDIVLIPGFTVELFDENLISLGVTPVNTNSPIDYTEGMFSYIGGSSVKRAVIDFNETSTNRFALDNLHFQAEAKPVSTPEPTIILGLIGIVGVGSTLKRKQVLGVKPARLS